MDWSARKTGSWCTHPRRDNGLQRASAPPSPRRRPRRHTAAAELAGLWWPFHSNVHGGRPRKPSEERGKRGAVVPRSGELRAVSAAGPCHVEAVEHQLVDMRDVARSHLEGALDVLVAEHREAGDNLGDLGADVRHVPGLAPPEQGSHLDAVHRTRRRDRRHRLERAHGTRKREALANPGGAHGRVDAARAGRLARLNVDALDAAIDSGPPGRRWQIEPTTSASRTCSGGPGR